MNYKTLTKEQIIISLDRLTRFKPTKEKYLRVFFDIMLNNLIEPRYKRTELEKIPLNKIVELASEIINKSLAAYSDTKNSGKVNSIIKKYEKSVFVNDYDADCLLNNDINYDAAKEIITSKESINLQWLKSLTNYEGMTDTRIKYGLKFPAEKVLLVEGLTEEILLPVFAKMTGFDFDKSGIHIIPAGGKNQVVKTYYKLVQEIKIPIFILLDSDAKDNINQIEPKLRSIDKIHLVKCGEFEDLLPKSLIIKTINKHLENFASITTNDFDDNLTSVKNLEIIFKEKGVHEFKKAEFAKLVKDCISEKSDVSDEIKEILSEIT